MLARPTKTLRSCAPIRQFTLVITSLALFASGFVDRSVVAAALASDESALESDFAQKILPLIENTCADCHDAVTKEAELDLSPYKSKADVVEHFPVWQTLMERVEAGEMPPADSGYELSVNDRKEIVDWIRKVRRQEASKNAGDPGSVLARRLSNAEYDNSIRDLTGVDLRPTREFPVDPANEAGFDNSGESLAMSPALMNKYLDAGRSIAEHLFFSPSGLRFAPHPVVTDTDRDKYCVKRIVDFYSAQPTSLGDYFLACWKHLQTGESLDSIAARMEISPKYLSVVFSSLESTDVQFGPLAELQTRWNATKDIAEESEATTETQKLAAYVAKARPVFEPHFDNLNVRQIHNGAQAFVLWKNDQYAQHRRRADFHQLTDIKQFIETQESSDSEKKKALEFQANFLRAPETLEQWSQFEADCQTFCSIYPDAFFISERGRDYLGVPREKQEKGRLLNAGFHSMMGYYRDDGPLMELILTDAQRGELDALWQELDFFASAPQRQYQGFLWFERTDSGYLRDEQFDFARPENKAALEENQIFKLAELYLEKARENGATEVPLAAIKAYFDRMNRSIRSVEQQRTTSEQVHVESLVEFASRAFRRPLTQGEQISLRSFYTSLRLDADLSHEEAIRDTLVSVLISPKFSYRIDLLSDSPEARALSDLELASRLSYFLWSSIPDNELLQVAARGELSDPEILRQQTRRMLRSPKIRGLATEFLANWLDVRRFEEHNSVDRARYPEFNDELRTAMFEEPIRFFVDLVHRDGSIDELLFSDHTFVNQSLAEHYGLKIAKLPPQLSQETWVRISDSEAEDRGGLLTMAAFLTKNSPGLRTSPVKRGYWVARRILGEQIPPPPPNVPDLPSDEADLGELTLRETLARHRDHASCAGCHDRFDSLGLVFEGYGPVGETRTEDFGGRAIDLNAEFPDGSSRTGIADLKQYIREERLDDFRETFCRKLLAFALCRSLQLSDDQLVERMLDDVHEGEFETIIFEIVSSKQFLTKRGRTPTNM